jgi:hypothetical protein
LVSQLGATPTEPSPDVEFRPPLEPANTCTVVAFLTDSNAVAISRDAGDPVAIDPSGTGGVKVIGTNDNASCVAAAVAALRALDSATPPSTAPAATAPAP